MMLFYLQIPKNSWKGFLSLMPTWSFLLKGSAGQTDGSKYVHLSPLIWKNELFLFSPLFFSLRPLPSPLLVILPLYSLCLFLPHLPFPHFTTPRLDTVSLSLSLLPFSPFPSPPLFLPHLPFQGSLCHATPLSCPSPPLPCSLLAWPLLPSLSSFRMIYLWSSSLTIMTGLKW